MKKINFTLWFTIGVAIGTSLGVAFNNIPAGLTMVAGTRVLVTLLSGLK